MLPAAYLSVTQAQEAPLPAAAPASGAAAPAGGLAVFRNNALTVTDAAGHSAHVMPTIPRASAIKAAGLSNPPGPLLYQGGMIMPTIQIYNIFWKPATLQSGAPANMTAHYMQVANGLAIDYAGHAIDNNNTQYYQTVNGKTTYVSGLSTIASPLGSYGGNYLDTAAYPTSGCSDSVTPQNCLTDAQLVTELKRVMTLKGWTGGLNKIYMIYTAQGEGSCFDASGGANKCAYTGYCAYHSNTTVGSTPVIYANEPWGDPNFCQVSGTPTPNNDAAADTATTAASHEITEAVTDPIPNTGWTDSFGYEIGDICAYDYGTNTWDSGKANQSWNGRYYEIQREWDNHANACVQGGP